MESKEITIQIAPVREKLRTLEQNLPEASNQLYDFANYLAHKLEGTAEIVPEGFCMLAEQALYDIKENNPTKMVPVSLQDKYGPGFLRTQVPKIARAVCPPDFAEEVLKIYRKMIFSR